MSAVPRVMIIGCGDVGSRLGLQLHAAGWQVHGLRRTVERLPAGIQPVAGDLNAALAPADWPREPLDYVVYTAAATTHDETGYRAAYVEGLRHTFGWLKQHGQVPRRLLFVSSSGVYGQQNGEWVDETSATEPSGYTGRVLLEAEQMAQASGIPATAVRLSGIYGPGREWLLNQVRQGYRVASEPPLYGNRIHAGDAAGLLACLLNIDNKGGALDPIYIGVDDEPAPLYEVVTWLRERLGVTHWAEEATVRRAGSKRCRNARARALGWKPQYPSYREGYTALLESASVNVAK
ncbi:nucleoside-diphosphate-sugar epimerase [Pseudomonas duriflava]|uniref:Nucleoside-diphosphate-sugar epimerase n=1 Tax=Pseudomonas duriflava TaxID=459528 RepID=A0A562QLN7_9PSED|nr:SDR family oxidoreductase [Pseudomonas duriflava]TWI57583.1 nucleoside-diphosphate-sugar epimerase [Pseudomonas duriflava]